MAGLLVLVASRHVTALVVLGPIAVVLGSFPVTTVVTGLLVGALGPSPFFVIAGVVLAAATLGALSRPAFRGFGASGTDAANELAPSLN
jgi:hypothetical protein